MEIGTFHLPSVVQTMTSKIKIDVAKIKEERKQYANKLELYKKVKSKQKKVNPLIKFDELKKFHALEQIASEPALPVDEYKDPPGISILDLEQYQNICNATSAYKKAVHRKAQANLKICNILNYSDYTIEEKQEIGLNLLHLMSIHPDHSSDCMQVLDRWVFEWTPTFLEICILFENLGCNVRKHLGQNYYIPKCYELAIVKTQLDYVEFTVKTSSVKSAELHVACLKNVFTYLKSITGYFKQEEIQSLTVVISALSLDTHCMQLREVLNELLNKCFACLENTNSDSLLNTLYLMIENSMYQCYFVNKILSPCNKVCKPFTIQLSYLFMCNLLFNCELVGFSCSLKNQSNSPVQSNQRDLRSKRKLVEIKEETVQSVRSPIEQDLEKKKILTEKENKKQNFEKSTVKQASRKGRGKGKLNTIDLDKNQKSLLDYWKVREKSPDLSKTFRLQDFSPKTPEAVAQENDGGENLKNAIKLPLETSEIGVTHSDLEQNATSEVNSTCVDLTGDCPNDVQSDSDDDLPTNTSCEQQQALIFAKYKSDVVSFVKLHRRIRRALQRHLGSPMRVYRIANLLNCIVKLIRIDESNMATCKVLMQELSHVQYKYYGMHDMHRHLVCVYLQQYTTVWGTHVNRIQFEIDQQQEYDESLDSE